MTRVALLSLLLACSSTQHSEPDPTPAPRPSAPRPSAPEAPAAPAEFVTLVELWAPDESVVLGVVLAMRETPRGVAADFAMPTGDHDPGDAHAVLFGAQLIREGAEVISANTPDSPRTFELSRRALRDPIQVWTFDDARIAEVIRLEPCEACESWRSPPTRFLLVVPEGRELDANPGVGWTIAISP